MKTNKTEVLVLLDRSGSMSSIKNDIEGAFKSYLNEQKKLPGECRLTLAQFDNEYEIVYENRLIQDINEIKIIPRGGTALIDSLARLIDDSGKRYAEMKEGDRPEQIQVLILSDGETNSDRFVTPKELKAKIELQTKTYSWKFTFIGCNFDNVTAGEGFGILKSSSLNFATTTNGINAAFAATSNATSFYRCSTDLSAAYSYTQEERDAAADIDGKTTTTNKVPTIKTK